jgi:hypothetical protein
VAARRARPLAYVTTPALTRYFFRIISRLSFQNKAGVDTMVTIHAALDNMFQKLDALGARRTGDPHPFVSKDAVDRFSTILVECGEAKLAWANGV